MQCGHKSITNIIVNRIRPLLHKLIRPQQSAFAPNRRIAKNTTIDLELIHSFRKKRNSNVNVGMVEIKVSLLEIYFYFAGPSLVCCQHWRGIWWLVSNLVNWCTHINFVAQCILIYTVNFRAFNKKCVMWQTKNFSGSRMAKWVSYLEISGKALSNQKKKKNSWRIWLSYMHSIQFVSTCKGSLESCHKSL